MPSIESNDPPLRLPRPPTCPECGTLMRLESGLPDTRYVNIRHMIFVCDCGRTSDHLIADPE